MKLKFCVTFLSVILINNSANACSCLYLSLTKFINASDLIFEGIVENIQDPNARIKQQSKTSTQQSKIKNINPDYRIIPALEAASYISNLSASKVKNTEKHRKVSVNSRDNLPQNLIASFKIVKIYKGKVDGDQVFITYPRSNGGNCGWNFQKSQQTLVIANLESGVYKTNLCVMGAIKYFDRNKILTELERLSQNN